MAAWADLTDAFNDDMQIGEMGKKYINCYLYVKPEGEGPVLCVYKGYIDGFHVFNDPNGMSIRVKHNTKSEIVCVHPEKGLFNARRRMFYYSKLPLRQYKRGICKDNCEIIDPVMSLWTRKTYLNYDVLEKALQPEYLPIQTAIEALRSGNLAACALDKNFGISLSFTKSSNVLFLWYHDTVIGNITKNDVIIIHNEFFEQEVLDNMRVFVPFKVEFNAKH